MKKYTMQYLMFDCHNGIIVITHMVVESFLLRAEKELMVFAALTEGRLKEAEEEEEEREIRVHQRRVFWNG